MSGHTHSLPQEPGRRPRMSLRAAAAMLGISHTQARRILAGPASLPHLVRYRALLQVLVGDDDPAWHSTSGQQAGRRGATPGEGEAPAAKQEPEPAFLTVHPEIARALVRALQDREGPLVLGVPQLARLLGRHPRTVRRWIEAGLLPASRMGGRYSILLPHVADLLAQEGVMPMEAIAWLRRQFAQRRLTRRDVIPRRPSQ